MMRMPNSLKVLLCGLPLCFAAFLGAAQPPLLLPVDANCQAEVPDFIENYDEVFEGMTPPWSEEANLDQFPEPGVVAPADITEEDWVNALPAIPFPNWPTDSMNVYVVATFDEDTTYYVVATLEDKRSPFLLAGAPNLYQRVVDTGFPESFPDFRPRLRPFIADNCSLPENLVMTQAPLPGSPMDYSSVPSGRQVGVTVTDEHGNQTSYLARVEVVGDTDARPLITPRGLNPADRRFADGCPGGWDCGLIAYWEQFWQCALPFDDPGATAYNPVTGEDLTHLIQSRIVGGHSTLVPYNEFTVRYWIGDEADLITNGLVERRVKVLDTEDPVITLGAIGGGPSGAQMIWRDIVSSADPNWEEPEWVQELREIANPSLPWVSSLPRFNFVSQPWNDNTAMPWRCWGIEPYQEYLDVYDDCEGQFDQIKLDSNVLVVIVKVRMNGEDYTNGEETFYAGGWLGDIRNSGLELAYGRPSAGGLNPNPWYGYRIYYMAWDSSNNMNFISRHVNPQCGEGINLAEPTTITIRCDGDLQQLWDAEDLDLAYSLCDGNISYVINRTGDIDTEQNADGQEYYVPGTYYRYYTIEGRQHWPDPWTRTIIVEDTAPDVQIYDELGNEVDDTITCGCISKMNALMVPWCEFMKYPGDTPQDQADAWEASWWAVQPGYPGTEAGQYGYTATHICEDDFTMTAWVDVRGVGVLKDRMMQYYTSAALYEPDEHLLGTYDLDFELNHPNHDLVRARRPVLLTDDISIDLVFSPLGYEVREEADRTVVRIECGSGTAFVLPEISRIWDNCTGTEVDRPIIIEAYEVVGTELQEVNVSSINSGRPGVYMLYYGALYSGSPVPAPVRTVEIRVEDSVPPEITLLGDDIIELECNEQFVDPGATAWDACDGDLTGSIFVRSYANTTEATLERYVEYTVSDSSGNEAMATRILILPEGLTITLNGVDYMEGNNHVTEWQCPEPYSDPGIASVTHICTGESYNVADVEVSPIPDELPPVGGQFTITYSFEDDHTGESVTVTRVVRIVDAEAPVITLEGAGTAPVMFLEDGEPEPAWWALARENYLDLYPEGSGYPVLPEEWRVAEAWEAGEDLLWWTCNEPAYEDPGAAAEDLCEGPLDENDIVLILTQYNVEEGREYFRYAGLLGDWEVNPPGHAYDDDGMEMEDRNLQQDVSGAVWPGYRAYYVAHDGAGNYGVQSRLIIPYYIGVNATPEEVTVECGDAFPELDFVAEDMCNTAVLESQRWIWRRDPDTGLEMDAPDHPAEFAEDDVVKVTGEYVVVYAVTDSSGNVLPPLDEITGIPVDPVALVERGGPFLQEILVQDTTEPVITLEGGSSIIAPYGESYVDPGYTALDDCDGDLTDEVEMEGAVDQWTLGLQTVIFRVTDGAGNSDQATRTVNVVDVSNPDITLSPPNVTWECGTVYMDAGVSARDVTDGTDLTGLIEVEGLVPELAGPSGARPGSYVITYRVSRYPGGNSDEKQRTVVVIDTQSPVITLNGDASIILPCGSEFVDAGVLSALDACDGDLTDSVSVSGMINTLNLGLQTVTYSVSDAAGNVVEEVRTVNIVDDSQPEIIVNPVAITLECGEIYEDTGVSARDNADGSDLTALIQVSGLVPSLTGTSGARPGTYEIRYYVQPVAGCNEAEATRTVTVVDSQAPVITLRGDTDVTVDCGASYRDAGVMSVLDDCDGDLSSRVVQIGNIDTNMPGLQTIVFSVKDQSGNEGTATRNVTVRDNCPTEGETVEGEMTEGESVEGEGQPHAQTQVPDVLAETVEDAEAIIATANLTAGEITYENSNEVPEGTIISQNPAPGTVVDVQSAVDLVVSAGPGGCGCDGLDGFKWSHLFLGVLAAAVLLVASLCTDGNFLKL